jgi:hypothetical protein
MAMTLGPLVAFAIALGLPLWLLFEELAHLTRSWRAAPDGEASTVDGTADPSPRQAL